MANLPRKTEEEVTAYIGEERKALLESFTQADWNRFYSLNLDLEKSYFVRGSKEQLKKFEAFYLMRCGYEKPLYASYILSEYIAHVGSVVADAENEVSFAEKDLLLLYVHNNLIGTGNSEAWVFTAALNKITIRNRIGFRTIVLSERNVAMLDSSSELESIRLGGSVENRDLSTFQKEAPQSTSNEEKSSYKSMAENTSF